MDLLMYCTLAAVSLLTYNSERWQHSKLALEFQCYRWNISCPYFSLCHSLRSCLRLEFNNWAKLIGGPHFILVKFPFDAYWSHQHQNYNGISWQFLLWLQSEVHKFRKVRPETWILLCFTEPGRCARWVNGPIATMLKCSLHICLKQEASNVVAQLLKWTCIFFCIAVKLCKYLII